MGEAQGTCRRRSAILPGSGCGVFKSERGEGEVQGTHIMASCDSFVPWTMSTGPAQQGAKQTAHSRRQFHANTRGVAWMANRT